MFPTGTSESFIGASHTLETQARGAEGARPMPTALTPKQTRFVAEYLTDLNGKQAATRAGYKASRAEVTASELLRDRKVSEAIAAGKAEQLAVAGLSAQRVLDELARVAFSDIRDLVDADGHLKPLHKLSDGTAGAIASIDVSSKNGNGDPYTVHRIRLWDKMRALELLAKHYALLTERVDHGGEIVFTWLKDELPRPAERRVSRSSPRL